MYKGKRKNVLCLITDLRSSSTDVVDALSVILKTKVKNKKDLLK